MKVNLYKELKSILITFLAIFSVEAGAALPALLQGDWSKPILAALAMAVLRSLVKTLLQLLWPEKFGKHFWAKV